MMRSSPQPTFLDVSTQCHYILEGIRLVRSEYLRTHGYFLPPSISSADCYETYRSLVSQLIHGLDIKSTCGYSPEWISAGCMNITSPVHFESLIPESSLREIKRHCSQSLENSSSCLSCSNVLLIIQRSYLSGHRIGNLSDCNGYPFLYAAALINPFGPTDKNTAECLFSLQVPSSKASRNTKHSILICVVGIGCVCGCLGAALAIWFILIRRRICREDEIESSSTDIETCLGSGLGSISARTTLISFTIEEIKWATDNFSRENIIGKGAYGNVYKGVLLKGSEVALKRLKLCSVSTNESFIHEIEVIASVRHINLLSIIGYCTTDGHSVGCERIIVCDLMSNGSLYHHLFGPRTDKLSWPIRQKIAIGIARGLSYLHYGAQLAIIHRDIKASNILLDENFEPKLADFGLAKFAPEGMTHLSTKVAGTLGYVAPEYALYGQLTEKSDVYSFGVVLLELLSGRKAVILDNEGETILLSDWAWALVGQGRALDVIEERIFYSGLSNIMEKYVLVSILCAHPMLHARPTMDQVVKMLENNLDNQICIT